MGRQRRPASSDPYWAGPGKPCPVCGETSGCCEHVCQSCDRIIEVGTCTNGRCEECCSRHCEGDGDVSDRQQG